MSEEQAAATVAEPKAGPENKSIGAVEQYFRASEEVTEPEAPEEVTPQPETPAEETPAEAKEEPESEPTEEPESPEEDEKAEEEEAPHDKNVLSQLPEELRDAVKEWNTEIVKKRVGKITAQKKAVEAELEAARAEKQTLAQQYQAQYAQLEENLRNSQPVPAFADDDPMSKITSDSELANARKEALQVKHWAEEALDSDEDEIEAQGKTYSKADVKRILRSARRDLEENLPAREKWISTRKQAEKVAANAFPWMADPNSKESVMLKAELAKRPHLARDPEAKWLIGLAMEGIKVLTAKTEEAKKPAKPKPKKEEPPPAPIATVVPAKSPSSSSQVERLRQKRSELTKANISRDDATNYFLEQETLRAGS